MSAQALLEYVPPLFRVLNGNVYFNGKCAKCRSFCAAACCREYAFVTLTEEEAKSGRYAYKEASDECGYATCRRMRELRVRYTVRKLPDDCCLYLDRSRKCNIHKDWLESCRKYSCINVVSNLMPA
jgi:hypothetical protein